MEVGFARCDCCGLTEECTEEYIESVRGRFSGRWICGLCAEAVEDEISRSEDMIGKEEALNQHMNFCRRFKAWTPIQNPTDDLICAVKQLLLKSLDSPPRPMRRKVSRSRRSCLGPIIEPNCFQLS